MTDTHSVAKHYGRAGLIDMILSALRSAGKDIEHLTTDDLAPVDEFHTRGRTATTELAQLLQLNGNEQILDMGRGIAGPSHIGNAAATEMFSRGEYNLGHLCRKEFGDLAYAIGFGTHIGTVAAASNWDGPMEIKTVLPSIPESYEHICHETAKPSFLLNLRRSSLDETPLRKPRFERAIGVIYRPETELASHYFQAVLPEQFDEYVWFDETSAITPFETKTLEDLPDTYPFGL